MTAIGLIARDHSAPGQVDEGRAGREREPASDLESLIFSTLKERAYRHNAAPSRLRYVRLVRNQSI